MLNFTVLPSPGNNSSYDHASYHLAIFDGNKLLSEDAPPYLIKHMSSQLFKHPGFPPKVIQIRTSSTRRYMRSNNENNLSCPQLILYDRSQCDFESKLQLYEEHLIARSQELGHYCGSSGKEYTVCTSPGNTPVNDCH